VLLLQIALRFVLGGLIVSAFAAIAEVLKPKSFAGIFGAAPSVALATLGLTALSRPPTYASLEGRSMLLGAVGLLAYCLLVGALFRRSGHHAVLEAGLPWLLWFAAAFGLWAWLLR
jgi:vacuolar-type H+-ATPase subunit I/STV1